MNFVLVVSVHCWENGSPHHKLLVYVYNWKSVVLDFVYRYLYIELIFEHPAAEYIKGFIGG